VQSSELTSSAMQSDVLEPVAKGRRLRSAPFSFEQWRSCHRQKGEGVLVFSGWQSQHAMSIKSLAPAHSKPAGAFSFGVGFGLRPF
jgi:hypothetical protein